jgi:hypothetical protein
MDGVDLAAKTREVLMAHAERAPISLWEYGSLDTLFNTVFATARTVGATLLIVLIGVVSLATVVFRRRGVKTKDTICIFVYMIVAIFLLETAQKAMRTSLSLSAEYSDVTLYVPENIFFRWRGLWRSSERCMEGIDSNLERKMDEAKLGKRAADAYRSAIRRRAHAPLGSAVVVDKKTGEVFGEAAVGRSRRCIPISGSSIGSLLEYCIINRGTGLGHRRGGRCIEMENSGFQEAKEEYTMVKRASEKYDSLRRELEGERREYRDGAIDLMNSFKQFKKSGVLISRELYEINAGLPEIEKAVQGIVSKFDALFQSIAQTPLLLIDIRQDAVCVKTDNRVLNKNPLEGRANGLGQETLEGGVGDTIMQVERRTYYDIPAGANASAADGRVGRREPENTPLEMDVSDTASRDKYFGGGNAFPLGQSLLTQSSLRAPSRISSSISARRGQEKNPFIRSVYRTLAIGQFVLFVEVALLFGLISSLVFDAKKVASALYMAMALFLLLSALLSVFLFSESAAMSALCERGLECSKRYGDEKSFKLFDAPFGQLKTFVDKSEAALGRQIKQMIEIDPLPEIEELQLHLQKIEFVRDDFNAIVQGNLDREAINKESLYSSIDRMKRSLAGLRRTNKSMRGERVVEVYRGLVEMKIMLDNTNSRYKEHVRRNMVRRSMGAQVLLDDSTCEGKERTVCALRGDLDILFLGNAIASIVLMLAIAI